MAERAATALEPHARDAESLHVLGMLTLRCVAATSAQDSARAVHWLGEAHAVASHVDDSNLARKHGAP